MPQPRPPGASSWAPGALLRSALSPRYKVLAFALLVVLLVAGGLLLTAGPHSPSFAAAAGPGASCAVARFPRPGATLIFKYQARSGNNMIQYLFARLVSDAGGYGVIALNVTYCGPFFFHLA